MGFFKTMGRKDKKTAKGRLDKFYYLAKEQGYRARSAFKLVQLNRKYDFLSNAKAVVDLGAAPGGWMQVARKYMPIQGIVIGVDLWPIKPIKHCQSVIGDFTTARVRNEIKKLLKGEKVDVVLHDGAPNTGVAWAQDAFSQAELTLMAFKAAVGIMEEGAWFITKVFRSSEYHSLLWVFNQLFAHVEATKPTASRNTSAEIYVICKNYKGGHVDPRFLSPAEVFKQVEEDVEVDPFLLAKKGRMRYRDGYDVDNPTLYKEISVVDFINAENPAPMLAKYNKFIFDDKAEIYKVHPRTTGEIQACMSDLQVLGVGELKGLLRWRNHMLKYIADLEKMEQMRNNAGKNEDSDDDDDSEDEEDVEEKEIDIDAEIEKSITNLQKKEKRKLRKIRAKRSKYQRRIDMKMVIPGDVFETGDDLGLFSISEINRLKGKYENDEKEKKKKGKGKGNEDLSDSEDDDEDDDDDESGLENADMDEEEREMLYDNDNFGDVGGLSDASEEEFQEDEEDYMTFLSNTLDLQYSAYKNALNLRHRKKHAQIMALNSQRNNNNNNNDNDGDNRKEGRKVSEGKKKKKRETYPLIQDVARDVLRRRSQTYVPNVSEGYFDPNEAKRKRMESDDDSDESKKYYLSLYFISIYLLLLLLL